MYLIPSARGLFIALLVWKGFVHFPKIKLFILKTDKLKKKKKKKVKKFIQVCY